MISTTMLLSNLGARDRTLFQRCALADSSRLARVFWKILTNAGGAVFTIVASMLPLLAGGVFAEIGRHALATLVFSHLVVQVIKRTVGRPRPSRGIATRALVAEPDRFSFPSGHAAAAMSVAFIYASAFPSLALPLVVIAVGIGMSRVFLGVHYPGDVIIGEIIAVLTGVVVLHG